MYSADSIYSSIITRESTYSIYVYLNIFIYVKRLTFRLTKKFIFALHIVCSAGFDSRTQKVYTSADHPKGTPVQKMIFKRIKCRSIIWDIFARAPRPDEQQPR